MTDDKPSPPGGTPNVSPGGASNSANPAPGALAPGTSKPIPPGAISAEPMVLPPIPLNPAQAAKLARTTPPGSGKKNPEPKDTFRELIETIVFVVVLVLMLKTFLAEAFVIPTGSMADTLLGYHYKVTCRQCGYPNLVNASSEAEPQDGVPRMIVSCQCQNCGFTNSDFHPNAAAPGGRP